MRRRRFRGRSSFLVAALAVVLAAGCGVPSPDSGAPGIVGFRGRLDGRFSHPRGIDVAADGTVAVADKTGRIQLFDAAGAHLRSWSLPKFDNGTPTGLTFDPTDPEGSLLVADTHNFRVLRYSRTGEEIGRFGEYGAEPGKMIYPTDVAIDDEGFLYIAEYGDTDRVLKHDRDGAFVKQWGSSGTEPGQFQRALALVFLPPDRIVVADTCNHRVQIFSTEGDLLAHWGEPGREAGRMNYPYDLAIGPRPGRGPGEEASGGSDEEIAIFVAEYGNNRLQAFDAEGRSLGVYGGPGGAPGEFAAPWGIARAPDGRLWVADTGNHRLQIVEPERVAPGE